MDDEPISGETRATTLAEYLSTLGTKSERIPPEDDIAELVACLPTSVCLRMLQAARIRLDAITAGMAHPQGKAGAEDKVRYWEDRVRVAYQRDQRVMERQQIGLDFARCFCLGQGGAGDLMVAGMPSGRGETLAAVVNGKPVLIWERVCDCPDGEKHRLSVRERVEQAQDALHATRIARIAGEARIPALYTDLTLLSWTQAAQEAGGSPEDIDRVMAAVGHWQDHCHELLSTRPVALNSSGRPGLRQVPRLLHLLGNHGTGESGLAAAIAQQWIEQEKSVLYRTMAQIGVELRASPYRHQRGEDGTIPTEYELLTAFMECDLLVIDDLGSEGLSFASAEKVREVLFLILDARLTACRPTIVTTNLGQAALIERYGSRIADRLTAPQVAVLAGFITPNLRRAAP